MPDTVKVGDVFKSNDPREKNRSNYVVTTVYGNYAAMLKLRPSMTGRRMTEVRINRLNKTGTKGWRRV